MSYPEPERYIPFQVQLLANHPALLEGLEVWLRLGLISDREVRVLCQQHLVCAVPEPVIAAATSPSFTPDFATVEIPSKPKSERAIAVATPRPQGWVSQVLQGLINEVSVIWLLCLGVFLVVASSAVMAANQWANLSPAGQYGILLTYTLAFIGASLWTAPRPQLQITARMLQMASLLLIPVNFWMMDGFKLLQSGGGLVTAAIAALLLSGAIVKFMPAHPHARWNTVNVLGLSWLHWGWGWNSIPMIATYIGCVGTAGILLVQGPQSDTSETSSTPWWSRITATDIVLPFAVLLLLFRAWVVAAVPLEQLGLAFGLCGWLLGWRSRNQPSLGLLTGMGLGLLALGWLVSIGAEVPWQALWVSGLGLWLLGDRLFRHHNPADLGGIFIVGLISLGGLIRLIPSAWREAFIAACTSWMGSAGLPDALWSLGLYPYLWGFLAIAHLLHLRQQLAVTRIAQVLSWSLGIALVGLGLLNPVTRSLSLALAFLTLGAVLTRRSSAHRGLIYLTHLLGVAAVFSAIDNVFPQFTRAQWGLLALGLMVAEWVALLVIRHPLWQESTWFLGLGLAGLGYLLLLGGTELAPTVWSSAALAIPAAFTALIFFPSFRWRHQALGLSMVSIIAVQLLTFEATVPRLAGLALGAGLMALNTLRSPLLLTAALSVGFGLTFGYATGWEVLPQKFHNWVMLSVGMLWGLVILRQGLSRQSWALSRPFQGALDGWAIALTVWTSLPLMGMSFLPTFDIFRWFTPQIWIYPLSSLLMTAALIYRYWQAPAQGWLVGIAWTLEVSVFSILNYHFGLSLQDVAIATLVLGFVSVGLGEIAARRTGQPYCWSWNLIPLGYGALGWLLGHGTWSATTGLFTLALALIGLGVGRRQSALLPITLLGVLGVSTGAFELLLYPLLRAQGGEAGDGLVLLGALALGLALMYRLSDPWGVWLLNLPPRGLSILGHLHWGLGSILAILALVALSPTGEMLWGIEVLALGGYGLWQGRQQSIWSYVGLAEIFMAIGQLLYTHLPTDQVLVWGGAITSAVALLTYSLPWQRWGWVQAPFTHGAIVLPIPVVLLSVGQINTSSLLIIGSFYGWIAFATQRTRLSYLGLPAVNWAALRLLSDLRLTAPIWTVGLVGLSLLLIAQIDPALQGSSRRQTRHLLRCFAVGLVSVTALYESDAYFWSGVFAIVLGLGLGVLGLLLRVRAFLYMGTLTVVFKVLRLIWLFVAQESQTLWILAFIPGVLIIWIAMTFEARRSQVTVLLQYWATTLEEWQ